MKNLSASLKEETLLFQKTNFLVHHLPSTSQSIVT
jgi:hypothetical protein